MSANSLRDARNEMAAGERGMAAALLLLAYHDSRRWRMPTLRRWLEGANFSLWCGLIDAEPDYVARKFLRV